MYEDMAPRLANVLVEHSVRIQPGDFVLIDGNPNAVPLIEALVMAVLRRGGFPHVQVDLPDLYERVIQVASDEQLAFINPIRAAAIEKADVRIGIIAPSNTRALAAVDPARIAKAQQLQRPLIEKLHARIGDHSLRWNVTAWPTNAAAQDAEMGLLAYTGFVYKACGLDHDDPVAYWANMREQQLRLTAWLNGKNHVEVRGPGIDLSYDFTGRPWCSSHGELNLPDGEVYSSPIEDSVNGQVAFNFPARYQGREVSGVRLVFKDGRVVEASAERGEDYLFSQLDLDEGARRLGEFSIGTNRGIQQYTGETLFDEKIGGTIHMALGNSYTETGGQNKSAIHWDMIHDLRSGGQILIDGEPFFRNGKFVV
ncbi:MAG: aminopeptidase [Anaerolineae bacterium]|nr:aminopeptidase [Anaerolineae bacterium]